MAMHVRQMACSDARSIVEKRHGMENLKIGMALLRWLLLGSILRTFLQLCQEPGPRGMVTTR
jgi:hypothetical protein